MPVENSFTPDNRILVKLRPSAALAAAESRANLRPLRRRPPDAGGISPAPFGAVPEPRWFVAEVPDGAATPWDLAHDRVAKQLGIAEADVLFAEPDIVHDVFRDDGDRAEGAGLAVGERCVANRSDGGSGKAEGPTGSPPWHLRSDFSQLEAARAKVRFKERRTRVAHLDTGYYPAHATVPEHVLRNLERNFVDGPGSEGDASDPDNKAFLIDNSGHGTGTISILAGRAFPAGGVPLGGAPDAAVVPLRIADRVVLLRTSAFASALDYAVDIQCDVASMSMGGLPSRAWRESVDRAYLAGLCLVAAAGNNANGLPTRNVVYPARYGRVIAACGVMANGKPYTGLKGFSTLEGNFGPDSVMAHAIASYTPNIPWARFGCPGVVRLNGEGTSSATPQVAAAVALWFEKYKDELPRDWRRVEAVRRALFSSAKQSQDKKRLGNGVLQARDALAVRPRLDLPQTKPDNDSFSFLRVLTGLGVLEAPPREQMFNLELAQRWLLSRDLQALVPDPDAAASLDRKTLARVMEAIIEDGDASMAVRRHMAARYPVVTGRSAPQTKESLPIVPDVLPACDAEPALANPPYRRLRVYAVDPSLSANLDTADVNEATLNVRWETLQPGPVGEYLDVANTDASGKTYARVNLDDPRLLGQDGWAPSEGNAQFHQQMTYAVAMTTIAHFERALGRPVLWRHRTIPGRPLDDSGFVRRMAVHPHALRQANAFYSPQLVALQFGYFEAAAHLPGVLVPGTRVYSCLSHDIVAHETTHAILDGMHRRFSEPSNADMLALHEGFADVVALLQHFTLRGLLRSEIARTRGDLKAESLLGSLAVQFGQASGGRGALRDAIGRIENGLWKRIPADPSALRRLVTPHARGAVLVAAVFDAFLAIYRTRTADLLRLYTGGTGVLPTGSIHPDLVSRLADEAAKSAEHVLAMCIRALDYLPPVDVTFFEYLRALITADFDVVSDDRLNYRVAFVESFRRHGIYPINLGAASDDTPRTLAVDTLRWQGLADVKMPRKVRNHYQLMVDDLRDYADDCLYLHDRKELFDETRLRRRTLQRQLKQAFAAVPQFAVELGLAPRRSFEVHELRRATRVSPDGRHVPQLIVALTQSEHVRAATDGTPALTFRGGSTLVIDLTVPAVKYRIVKHVDSVDRKARTLAFVRASSGDPLRALFFAPDQQEPFAALHALSEEGL